MRLGQNKNLETSANLVRVPIDFTVQSQPDIMFEFDEVVLSKIHHPLGIVSNTIFSKKSLPLTKRINQQKLKKARQFDSIWSNYSDLTRPGPPNSGLVREIPEKFQGNLGG